VYTCINFYPLITQWTAVYAILSRNATAIGQLTKVRTAGFLNLENAQNYVMNAHVGGLTKAQIVTKLRKAAFVEDIAMCRTCQMTTIFRNFFCIGYPLVKT